MKIIIINGTEVKGCTYHIKESFLASLRDKHEIVEFYLPKDMPHFCCGCKVCFFKTEDDCPHAQQVAPIWTAVLEADLLVFTAPVYGLGIPAGMKALLDHFCVHWMVHRPDPAMFGKRAVIMTNCVGMPFMAKSAQRDIIKALSWMGVSKIQRLGIGLLEGVIWDELSENRKTGIKRKARRLGSKHISIQPARKSIVTKFLFCMSKVMHAAALKNEDPPSADNQHWIEHGWLKQ
ncbi:MAG: NAD(P)H-dependent oxidoreductase [Clostridiales bacterium]|nr:NAD(P)H-dependent oxidoreductase [Clostridiales bacterium]